MSTSNPATKSESRRERQRRATLEEIRAEARTLLVTSGPEAVTINAIARRMNMRGPSIYRYYASHDELVSDVTADFFQELTAVLDRAKRQHRSATPGERLITMCRSMRAWATTHPREFSWVFAQPTRSSETRPATSPRSRAGQDFERLFLDQFVELWERDGFPAPDFDVVATELREQVETYASATDAPLPPEAVHVFLTCWIRLYGLLCMEVFDQLQFAFADVAPVFEECLRDICSMLEIPYELPVERG